MTEQEWLAETEPLALLAHLRGRVSDRKLLLFCCACCLQTADAEKPEARDRFLKTQAYADNPANEALLSGWADPTFPLTPLLWASKFAAWSQWREEHDALPVEVVVAALRHIVGNPFRSVALDRACLTPTVLKLAAAVYDDRQMQSGRFDPQRLAVLADALEDAGCDHADLLGHLRSGDDHVRGCWAVDLVLGKE